MGAATSRFQKSIKWTHDRRIKIGSDKDLLCDGPQFIQIKGVAGGEGIDAMPITNCTSIAWRNPSIREPVQPSVDLLRIDSFFPLFCQRSQPLDCRLLLR
jgi:hypothetical protein